MKIKYQSDQEESRWNHRPKQPVNLNPLFDWPPKFMAIVIWYSGYWLAISTTTLALALTFIAYCTILPPLEVMQIVRVDWIVRVWLANLVPHILCASLLHLWLYEMKGQNKDFKFDPRPLATKNRTFSFSNQVHDNMFWTLASGVTQWSMIQSIVFWAMANGYAPAFLFPDNIIWFFLMFPFLIFWASFHFYWIHRALHWPPLYRIAHAVHHRNINIGPWSGISMHPIEHLIFYSNFLIHFIVPSHPLHIMFHGYMQSIHPIFSHSGFEKLYVADKERANMGDFFHQLHHRYFECNYGTVEMPWDRWFGSFHDGSEKGTQKVRERKKNTHFKNS